VAILDTGYDRHHGLIVEAQRRLPHDAGIVFKDFVGTSKKPIDKSGHGTLVAYLLLEITQNVDIWMARVYEGNEGTPESAGRVAKVCYEAVDQEQDSQLYRQSRKPLK